jgi:hypothetical protein
MPTDIEIYCNCMAGIRDRINVVQTIMSGPFILGLPDQTAELIFVQFRKALEEIAFASLSANREKYSEVHANFSKHWRAKDMLAVLDKVNPGFFPIAQAAPVPVSAGPPARHHFERLTDGFLTRDDFVFLYKCASESLHTHNPYRDDDQTIRIRYTVQEWVARFQRLLSWHSVTLLNGDVWVTNVPGEGHVSAWPSTPVPFLDEAA